ncbi:MAG: YggS family pyridoxal phosphate-dependent enzyme, partial [Phycisphaerae bacterium]|nr:YggS family pyridoxal phosphate-dependent enzyme [Phycisphaerae bacterium]
RIAAACQRCGRKPEEVQLIAVTKTVEIDVVRTLVETGLMDFGESRAQELIRRAGMIREHLGRRRVMDRNREPVPADPRWHMVGHVQRNKVRAMLPWVDVVHSLDSLRLAEEISEEAVKTHRTVPVLMEVNVSGERSKFGIAVGAAAHLAENLRSLPGLSIIGLMTMAPLIDPAETRPYFARLREVFEDMRSERVVGPEFRELSMGMSNDFEVAIEEGSTMVRIGSTLFENIQPAGATE